jgi:hypothetical protein
MSNPDWTPSSQAEQEASIFSDSTRDYYAAEIRKKAIQALVLGILSVIFCPLIFGIWGYMTANEVLNNIAIYGVEHDKRTMAQIGKVLSIVGIVLWVLTIIIKILAASRR